MRDKFRNLTDEQRELLMRFPTLTKEELESVNDMFKHYVFYKTVKGGRILNTSCCHQQNQFYASLQPVETPEHWMFMMARHNDSVVCPYCGKRATLKSAGIKKRSLRQDFNIVFLHAVDGLLFAQAYIARKDYDCYPLNQEPVYCSFSVYVFKIGKVMQFWTNWNDEWVCMTEEGKIGRRIQITEPFRGHGLFQTNEVYYVIHREALSQSQMRYCQYYEYWRRSYPGLDDSLMRYLTVYCIYPRAVEMLVKNGMCRVVADLIFQGKKNAAAIRWNESNPRKAFNLSPQDLKAFLSLPGRDIDCITQFNYLQKHGVKMTFSEIDSIKKQLPGWYKEFFKDAVKYGTTPKKLVRYLDQFTGGCHAGWYRSLSEIYRHWIDYITAAEKIGYDMTQHNVVFPRNLGHAHDTATAELNRRMREALEKEKKQKREEQMKLMAKRIKKYSFELDGYIIRPAESSEEIIAEGNALKHCVGGYADRHMEGKLTICFMRPASDPDKPYLTIELSNDGKLQQIHGYKNERENGIIIAPDPREVYKDILDTWLKWIAAGSKRDAEGKPKIPKKKESKIA